MLHCCPLCISSVPLPQALTLHASAWFGSGSRWFCLPAPKSRYEWTGNRSVLGLLHSHQTRSVSACILYAQCQARRNSLAAYQQ
ncbi:Uncharacterised protein [Vibrio cholerae]|nr:Uncharacterised protein [Vibrio cholerae]